MENWRSLGLHLIFLSTFLVATTYTCLGVGNISVVCSEQERLALLKFKESVADESKMLSSWVGNDCCMWERIRCDSVTGKVTSIRLRGNTRSSYNFVEGKQHDHFVRDDYHLVGNQVDSSLAALKQLKFLDLSGNDFRGSRIPDFIGSFKQLSYLNLSHVGFQGIIPPHIGNLSNLKVLDLNANGDLMANDMSWTFGLSSLEHLDLSYLDVSGMDIGRYMIPSLEELRLSSCGLSSADLGSFINSTTILPNIKHLDLSLNPFKGPLPGFLQNMTSLAFLDLSDFDLSLAWNFPNLLSMIPSLSELHLSGCGLDKTHLSSTHLNFSTLSNIRHLDLSRNSIEGIIPSVLTNMSSLRVLDLSLNNLHSLVPIMPNLLELDLSSNWFKKIEHLGIWRQCHLKKLIASDMAFDIEMMNSQKNISECSQYALERLDLRQCINSTNSEPTIPEPLGTLANLRSIDLSACRLTGPIPESLGRLQFLEVLDLSYNQLTGPIPTFLGKLSKLDLSFNQLNGSIPESFGKLVALTDLYLEVNQLTGPIPTSIGSLVSLKAFSVYSNLLNGSIPVSIGQLGKLDWLDVFNNSLEGVVFEAHFANMSMLKHFDTSYNSKLTFNVSREWIPSFQLVTLLLSSCTIANGFPQWLQNQRELEMLVLFNATITGPLPTWLQKMPIIPFLDLSHNKLCGPLTNLPNGGNVDALGYGPRALYLEDNLFNESIPRSLCRRKDLEYLNLSRNRLTGKIPKCLENLQKLVTMRFSSNRLSGVIPSSIAFNCSSLLRLTVNDNSLIGEIPHEWGNLRDLQYLDLGDNKLSGNIPEWIGEKLASLIILRLHKNNFTGRIPRSLCKASYLQILDVASNNLTGTIPHCLGDLTNMINGTGFRLPYLTDDYDDNIIQVMKGVDLHYTKTLVLVYNLDLSSNKLVGEIPVELTALSLLLGLNLSNNHLSGGIPVNIGNMTALFSLDLSGNQLTGAIPPSIATLNFLSHLNLSHNNLAGRIPTGNQLQTLIDPSIYVGNKALCGTPLPKNCTNQEDPTTSNKIYDMADKSKKVWLFYVDIVCGFATGFWGIIGVLLFKKQWRWKLFRFADETMDRIYVAVMVRVAKMKRGREAA